MTIDRKELRRLCEAATPGPWRACKDGACDCRMIWARAVDCVVAVGIAAKDEQYTSGEGIVDDKALTANAAFIAAARTALPALLDALEAAEATLEKVRIQLAACGVIAMANTPDSAKNARTMHPDYDCASIHDVSAAVDREMAAREALKAAAKRENDLRYFLRLYIHAHERENAVPPNIDGDARKALAETVPLATARGWLR